MPPALETIDLDDDSDVEALDQPPAVKTPSKYTRQPLFPVIPRTSTKPAPVPARQYPDGPLPLQPSTDAPRKARITGRVVDDDGVSYTLMIGQIPMDGIGVHEILEFVSAYDLEEYENTQFIEEVENRKIAKAAEEAEWEARRLRKLEKIRKKGLVVEDRNDDPESNEESDVAVGRHGRARPTYTHLYKLPGGSKDGTVRRRRKRDPSTGELMPLSDEEMVQQVESSDDEPRRTASRPEASRSSTLALGLELPKRRRRKRDPLTGELMPLSGDDNNMSTSDGGPALQRHARPTTAHTMELPDRSSLSRTMELSVKTSPARRATLNVEVNRSSEETPRSRSIMQPPGRSSSARQAPYNTAADVQKRRRRRRDPRTGELLPLTPEPVRNAVRNMPPSRSTLQQTEERKKRPRRRRHPITSELMPLGWVYDPDAEARTGSYETTAEVSSMHSLSITPRDSKRVKLGSEPSSEEDQRQAAASSPHTRRSQVVEMESSSEEESQDELSSVQLSAVTAPVKATTTQVRSPKQGMLQRADSSSSNGEPITLASFLSTTATGNPQEDEDEDDTSSEASSEIQVHNKPAPQKTSMIQPMAAQEDSDDEDSEDEDGSGLDEGEYFVEGILAHHWSDPRTHPGKPQTMLYHTKWEGYADPTWEPATSFPDQSVVEAYRKHVGLE